MSLVLGLVVLVGCAGEPTHPQLASIEPSLATSLVETPAAVRGAGLDAMALVDLDSAEASIDRSWRVRIAGVMATTLWRDRAQLDVVIPRGLVAGVHDVTAIAPDGSELVLAAALTITAEPVGLRLGIESAPGGIGQLIAGVRTAGDQGAVFAVVRDPAGTFVTDVAVTWGTTGPFAHVDATDGHALFEAQVVGSGRLTATHAGAHLVAESGELTTIAGAAARISIVDGLAGPATVIGDRTGLTTDADGGLTAHVVAVDAFDNVIADATAIWTLTGITGSVPATTSTGAVLDFTTPGIGQLHATHAVLGTTSSGTLTVVPGRAATLAITPDTLDAVTGEPPIPFSATGTDADGNATPDLGTLGWTVAIGPITAIHATTGMLTPITAGVGAIRATSSYGATTETGVVQIRRAAALEAVLGAPAQILVGDAFTISMTTTNTGDNAATDLTPCALTVGGTGAVTITATPGMVPVLAAGASTISTWSLTAVASGPTTFATCATAVDATTMAVVTATATGAITVLRPAQLDASFVIPSLIGLGAPFTATLTVTNSGDLASDVVAPSVLTATGSGSGTLTTAAGAPTAIAPGVSAVFTWSFDATGAGTVQLHGMLGGASFDSNVADILDDYYAAVDPFGDGTSFGFVTGYGGQIYLGPNATGTSAARMSSPLVVPEPLSFLFARDSIGNAMSNLSTPYTSIGAAGCAVNTPACGPDNENQRGLFTSVVIAGTEWLIATGAKSLRGAGYVYMTTDTDTTLDFRYVDLNQVSVAGNTNGVSALGAVGNRLYIGTSGVGSARAKLFGLDAMPPAPGLNPTAAVLVDMHLERVPGWTGVSDPQGVDAIANAGGIAYVANPQNWIRASSTSPAPVPALCMPTGCGDWVMITPSAAAYAARPSRLTTKVGQLEPADRSVVQIVQFEDQIFVARNTTTGPQLWSCQGTATNCNAGDWNLVAANTTGDTLLTQFDDPSLTSVSMLVATANHVYIGFDSTSGVRVFRTALPAAEVHSDFEAVGGPGLGAPTNTRIFDAKAITAQSETAVWITAGDLASPFSLMVIP